MNTNDTPKPVLTHREASYQVAHAGAEARKAAAAAGADPRAMDALMEMGAITTIGGIPLHKFSMSIQWCLQKLDSSILQEDGKKAKDFDLLDVALTALCFSEPSQVFALLKANRRDEIERLAFELGLKLTPKVMDELNTYFMAEFGSVKNQEPSTKNEAQEAPTVGEPPAPAPGG